MSFRIQNPKQENELYCNTVAALLCSIEKAIEMTVHAYDAPLAQLCLKVDKVKFKIVDTGATFKVKLKSDVVDMEESEEEVEEVYDEQDEIEESSEEEVQEVDDEQDEIEESSEESEGEESDPIEWSDDE